MTEDIRSIDLSEYMDMAEVAKYLGVKYHTFTAYVYRDMAPEHDLKVRRTRLWSKETIDKWREKTSPTKDEIHDGNIDDLGNTAN